MAAPFAMWFAKFGLVEKSFGTFLGQMDALILLTNSTVIKESYRFAPISLHKRNSKTGSRNPTTSNGLSKHYEIYKFQPRARNADTSDTNIVLLALVFTPQSSSMINLRE